jgi:hypothetical protein
MRPNINNFIIALLDEQYVADLEKNSIDDVYIRSIITCDNRHGVCAKCYGRDLEILPCTYTLLRIQHSN